jgi:hypothetical protein
VDPERFDALVQSLARPGSRRRLLSGLLASGLVPVGAAAKSKRERAHSASAAGAASRQPTAAKAGANGPQPAACLSVGKRCTLSESRDARHGKGGKGGKGKHHPPSCNKCCSRYGAAGSDGKARCGCKPEEEDCANPAQCCGGLCRGGKCTKCPGSSTACNGNCVDLQTDAQHCGDCATTCADGQRCVNGNCVCDATSCPNGCCDGATCVRFAQQSNERCGAGGAACAACTGNDTCGGGNPGTPGVCGCTAATTCPNGQTCGSAPNNCGGTIDCAGCAGCCDGKTCHDGTDDGACGRNGEGCVSCSSPRVCYQQACCTPDPDAATCAGKCGMVKNNCGQQVNCTALCAGCCSGAVCKAGTSNDACGANDGCGGTCDGTCPTEEICRVTGRLYCCCPDEIDGACIANETDPTQICCCPFGGYCRISPTGGVCCCTDANQICTDSHGCAGPPST